MVFLGLVDVVPAERRWLCSSPQWSLLHSHQMQMRTSEKPHTHRGRFCCTMSRHGEVHILLVSCEPPKNGQIQVCWEGPLRSKTGLCSSSDSKNYLPRGAGMEQAGPTIKRCFTFHTPRSSFTHVWLMLRIPSYPRNKIWPQRLIHAQALSLPPYYLSHKSRCFPSSSELLAFVRFQTTVTRFPAKRVGYSHAEPTALQSSLNTALGCLHYWSSWQQSFWWQSLCLERNPFARGGTTAWN